MDSAGVPVWYKRGAANRVPRDLKRLADGSLAWFQTFGPGFGSDPANGYENFPLERYAGRSHPDRRCGDQPPRARPAAEWQLPAHVDAHHRPARVCPIGDATCRRQNATGTYPAVMSDFVLRAVVQEVDPAGNLVRDWNSSAEIALGETTVPICFQSLGRATTT